MRAGTHGGMRPTLCAFRCQDSIHPPNSSTEPQSTLVFSQNCSSSFLPCGLTKGGLHRSLKPVCISMRRCSLPTCDHLHLVRPPRWRHCCCCCFHFLSALICRKALVHLASGLCRALLCSLLLAPQLRQRPVNMSTSEPEYPQLIAFDLDYTLWFVLSLCTQAYAQSQLMLTLARWTGPSGSTRTSIRPSAAEVKTSTRCSTLQAKPCPSTLKSLPSFQTSVCKSSAPSQLALEPTLLQRASPFQILFLDCHGSPKMLCGTSRNRAKQALKGLVIPITSAETQSKELVAGIELFDEMEIYPGSKMAHFQSLQRKVRRPRQCAVAPSG